MTPLLTIRDLAVDYRRPGSARVVRALTGVDLSLDRGETLGVLGESGSGKTTLGLAIPGLLPGDRAVVRGEIAFQGQPLVGAPSWQLRRLRGAEIGCVFQEPALALHPMRRVGAQVVEVLRAHQNLSAERLDERVQALFAELGLDREHTEAFPHQLSGGQRQRVVLAQALAGEPALLIADEPTASLDAVTSARVLALLQHLTANRGLALLHIAHDPRALEVTCQRVAVLYAGEVVEAGPRSSVFARPRHPYTAALLACAPQLDPTADPATHTGSGRQAWRSIPGEAPDPTLQMPGCRFAPRCDRVLAPCEREHPELSTLADRWWVRCENPCPTDRVS